MKYLLYVAALLVVGGVCSYYFGSIEMDMMVTGAPVPSHLMMLLLTGLSIALFGEGARLTNVIIRVMLGTYTPRIACT